MNEYPRKSNAQPVKAPDFRRSSSRHSLVGKSILHPAANVWVRDGWCTRNRTSAELPSYGINALSAARAFRTDIVPDDLRRRERAPPIFARLISTDAPGFARSVRCPWHDIRIADASGHWRNISYVSRLGEQMGEVVQFIPKSDSGQEAARLIREARAIYEAIFPTELANVTPSGDDDTSP